MKKPNSFSLYGGNRALIHGLQEGIKDGQVYLLDWSGISPRIIYASDIFSTNKTPDVLGLTYIGKLEAGKFAVLYAPQKKREAFFLSKDEADFVQPPIERNAFYNSIGLSHDLFDDKTMARTDKLLLKFYEILQRHLNRIETENEAVRAAGELTGDEQARREAVLAEHLKQEAERKAAKEKKRKKEEARKKREEETPQEAYERLIKTRESLSGKLDQLGRTRRAGLSQDELEELNQSIIAMRKRIGMLTRDLRHAGTLLRTSERPQETRRGSLRQHER